MYRRSYDYNTTPEQRERFVEHIKNKLDDEWLFTIYNQYPYDMCRDKKVKTKHLTMFFNDFSKKVFDRINYYYYDWYTVQINSSDNQSIPEINHLHFIKIIE